MIFFIKKRNSKYLLMISILIVCMISLTLLINETRKNATVYLNKNNNVLKNNYFLLLTRKNKFNKKN